VLQAAERRVSAIFRRVRVTVAWFDQFSPAAERVSDVERSPCDLHRTR
jgi:hypothetical protein